MTITVVYIMTISTLGFEESLTVVKHCREIANPNFGFKTQMRKYGDKQVEEERKKLKLKYDGVGGHLEDEKDLRSILKEAQGKVGQREDPHPFDPEAFTRKKSD